MSFLLTGGVIPTFELSGLRQQLRFSELFMMSAKNIINNQNGKVAFRYVDSSSGKTRTRQLKGEDFVWLVLQHVLPKGFRRVRDYGFLHGNAKARLARLQLILQVLIKDPKPRKRPNFICPKCQSPMHIIGFICIRGTLTLIA